MSIKFANDDDLKNAAKTFRQHAAVIEQQFNSEVEYLSDLLDLPSERRLCEACRNSLTQAARAHGMMMPAPVILRPSRSW